MYNLGSNLLRYNDTQEYITADFETFNLNLMMENLPWQVAWITYNKTETISSKNIYINWDKKAKISKDAARITGYDEHLIRRIGISPEEGYKIFSEAFNKPNKKRVAQNWIGFDSMIKKSWEQELGYKVDYSYLETFYDTNCLAKAIKKGFKIDVNNLFQSQIKVLNYLEKGLKSNIGFLCKEYGLQLDEFRLHKADYDVEKNAEIFLKQIWQLDI